MSARKAGIRSVQSAVQAVSKDSVADFGTAVTQALYSKVHARLDELRKTYAKTYLTKK